MNPSAGRAPAASPLEQLRPQVALLQATPTPCGDDDPAGEAAYYASAERVVERVISISAATLHDLQVKAEAVAWANASRSEFGLGDTTSDRLISSILRDLLAA